MKILTMFLVPCVWDAWGDWSTCSKTCGGGDQTRTRIIKQEEEFLGAPCQGDKLETRSCASNQCPGRHSNKSIST